MKRPSAGSPSAERPVDHAIETQACRKCKAPIGTPCRVEIFGRLHDGAHHERLRALAAIGATR